MLSKTLVINGTSGADTWSIDAHAGTYVVNGSSVFDPLVTDIQVNGLDNFDLLIIDRTDVPVVFNGGNGDDWLDLSDNVGNHTANISGITAPVTINGGPGTDLAQAFDDNNPLSSTYSINGSSFQGGSSAPFNFASSVERFGLVTGKGNNAIYINNMTAAVDITVFAGTGGNALYADMNTLAGNLTYYGDPGAGYDSLQVSDYNRTVSSTYTVTSTSISRSGRVINYSYLDSVLLQGTGMVGSTYNVPSSLTPLSLLGGTANDIFNLTLCNASTFGVNGSLIVDGFGGSDTLIGNAMAWTNSALTFWVTPTSISINSPTPVITYSGIASFTLQGPAQATTSNCSYVVTGTASSITGQTTILAGTGDNNVYIYPHDESGNLTIPTNLGIGGGGGNDRVIIDDAGQSQAINYKFYNPFGSGTEDISGMGGGLVGAGSDVETVDLRAGDGDDRFDLETWQSGSALVVNAGGGNDRFQISPNVHSLPAAITSMSYFSFDGGGFPIDGADYFDIINDNNTSAWTIIRSSTNIVYSTSGYTLVIYLSHLGYLFASGGTQNDTFEIQSTPADNMNNDMYGAGGSDTYNIGLLGRTSGIRSYVNIDGFGGNSQVTVDDSADSVGRSFHVDQYFINSVPSDTLFPAAGGDIYGIIAMDSVSGTVTLKLGSGADSIDLVPSPTATFAVQASNPTTAPGDGLTLGFADAANPVFTPGATGAGSYTFSNRAPLSYTGIETNTIDDVAPSVVSNQYNYSPAVGSLPSIDLEFSEDVSPGLYNTYFDVYNITTAEGFDYRAWSYSYNTDSNTVSYTFPSAPGGILPDGDYSASISRVTDVAGNRMAPYTYQFNFFVLTADANHDRSVDTVDFNILAANFGQSDKTFGQGDFNYDGSVDTVDFNLLAGKFGQTLAAPAASLPILHGISASSDASNAIDMTGLADELLR